MNNKIKSIIMTVIFAIFTLGISVMCIATPDKTHSLEERRELVQFPEITTERVLNGDFSSDFEAYTTDQFPNRSYMRAIKTFVAQRLLAKADNNGIFIKDGHISKLDTTENPAMLDHAANRFNYTHDKYLKENKVYFSIIPDKNYVLARPNGYPSLDYEGFIERMKSKVDFQYIDITDLLSAEDFYTTDTHWRQENIIDIADRLANAMGKNLQHNYTVNTLDSAFYGVYAGQYAGHIKPDTIKYLTSDVINSAKVTYDDGMKLEEGPVYNMEKAMGKDPYEMFLSGTMPLITLENPLGENDDELYLFRDSYGSSIAPILLSGYKKITVIDIRYIKSDFLGAFIDFNKDADVLFLYSSTLLNNSMAMQ